MRVENSLARFCVLSHIALLHFLFPLTEIGIFTLLAWAVEKLPKKFPLKYIRESHLVIFRSLRGAGVAENHPLSLRFPAFSPIRDASNCMARVMWNIHGRKMVRNTSRMGKATHFLQGKAQIKNNAVKTMGNRVSSVGGTAKLSTQLLWYLINFFQGWVCYIYL